MRAANKAALCAELLSALISSSLQYLSACGRGHSLSETVNLASLPLLGLISSFHFILTPVNLFIIFLFYT